MKRTHNIFISSTFQDMHAERDLLHNVVIPELISRFSHSHIHLDLIDLRWGIDTADDSSEQENTAKILRVCFDEIERSKPFFIGFIGERYGWIPNAADIESAALGYGMRFEDGNAALSITELEMRYALQKFTDGEHCLFFIRNGLAPQDIADPKTRSIYFPEDGALKQRCDLLKAYLRREFGDRTFDYACHWDREADRIAGLEALGTQLTDLLDGIIRRELACEASADTGIIAEERRLQENVLEQLGQNVFGREEELQYLSAFLDDPARRELAVVAPSGLGKSSLAAAFCQLAAQRELRVVPFLAGISEQSRQFRFLTQYCCQMLQPQDERALLALSYPELKKRLLAALVDAAEKQNVLIVVDALDQFSDSAELQDLDWLHDQIIPQGVKILYTSLPGREEIFRKRSTAIYELTALKQSAVPQAAAGIAGHLHKELHREALELLMGKQDSRGEHVCCVPIYLVSLLELLCSFDSDDFARIAAAQESTGLTPAAAIRQYVADTIRSVGCSINDVLRELTRKSIAQLGAKYDTITALLVSSPQGITEKEILGISAGTAAPVTAADFSLYRRMFRMHLRQRQDGNWSFTHAIIRDAMVRRTQALQLLPLWEAAVEYYQSLPCSDPGRCGGIIRYLGKCGNYPAIAEFCREPIDDGGAGALYSLALETDTPEPGQHPLLSLCAEEAVFAVCRCILRQMQRLGAAGEAQLDLACSSISAMQTHPLDTAQRLILLSDFYCFGGGILLQEGDARSRSFYELGLNILLRSPGVHPAHSARLALTISRIFSARQDRFAAEQYAKTACTQAQLCAAHSDDEDHRELLAQACFELGCCIRENPLSLDRFQAGKHLSRAMELAVTASLPELSARAAITYLDLPRHLQSRRHRTQAQQILAGLSPEGLAPRTQVQLQLYLAAHSPDAHAYHQTAYEAAILGLAMDNSTAAMELYETAAEEYGYSLMLHRDPEAAQILGNADRVCRKLDIVTGDIRWNDRRIAIDADLRAWCRAHALPQPDESIRQQTAARTAQEIARGSGESLARKNIYAGTALRIGAAACLLYALFMAFTVISGWEAMVETYSVPYILAVFLNDLLLTVINIMLTVTMNYLAMMIRSLDKHSHDHRMNSRLLTRNILLCSLLAGVSVITSIIIFAYQESPYDLDSYYGFYAYSSLLIFVFTMGITWFIAYFAAMLTARSSGSALQRRFRWLYRSREVLRSHGKFCLFAALGIGFFLPCIWMPGVQQENVLISFWGTRVPDHIPLCWLPLAAQLLLSRLELERLRRECGGQTPHAAPKRHGKLTLPPVLAAALGAVVLLVSAAGVKQLTKRLQHQYYGYFVEDGFYCAANDAGDGVYVYGYSSPTGETDVILPEKLGGQPVRDITSAAFDYSDIESITLPAGITVVPEEAFEGCTALRRVTLPGSVQTIGSGAFLNCVSLETIVLPEGLLTIEEDAFLNCVSLNGVNLPPSLTKIGSSAFQGCFSLTDLTVPEDIQVTISSYAFTDSGLEYSDQVLENGFYPIGTSIVCVNKDHTGPLVIPEGITQISRTFFQNCTGITELYLPEGLVTIEPNTFRGCTSLYYVSLPESLESIGDAAFEGCGKLLLIDSASSVDLSALPAAKYGRIADPRTGESALPERTAEGLLILDTPYNEYWSCQLLSCDESQRFLTLDSDYQGKPLRIPAELFTPFSKCVSVTLNQGDGDRNYVSAGESILSEVLEDGATSAIVIDGQGLIYLEKDGVIQLLGHTGIRTDLTIDFPAPVQIHPYAFRGDRTITALTIRGEVEIPAVGFSGCIGLKTLDAEGKVTIGEGAFQDCRALETAELEVLSLGEDAFRNCVSLKSIRLPDSISRVSPGAFRNCVSLTSAEVPGTVTLGEGCFENCLRLESVTLGSALTEIGAEAFSGCVGMKQVHFGGTVNDWAAVSFEQMTSSPFYAGSGVKLIVGGETVTALHLDEAVTAISAYCFYDYDYLTELTMTAATEAIGQYAFYHCSYLNSVTLSPAVEAIEECTFSNCVRLEAVDLTGVTEVGTAAFYNCEALAVVTGYDAVSTIGYNGFSGCGSLQSLPLGSALEVIGDKAFQNCVSMEQVRIPPSVTQIGTSLFTGCTGLQTLELPEAFRGREIMILGTAPAQVILYD